MVAPSLPGYGFSSAPTKPGFGVNEIAHTFDELMVALGYTSYVAQGVHAMEGAMHQFAIHAFTCRGSLSSGCTSLQCIIRLDRTGRSAKGYLIAQVATGAAP